MTIKELYDMALERNIEDYEFVVYDGYELDDFLPLTEDKLLINDEHKTIEVCEDVM